MNKTALVMFSWGLDSLLTIKILESQGIDVTALTYESPFFKATKAKNLSEHYGIKHIVRDISDPHYELVKNPRYWYGKNMNPCVDCHGFMFNVARQIADEMGIAIVASWEVFGQRPFSQNKKALENVTALAWCDILRPLSAKLLDETEYERDWLVDRSKLYDIRWKSRQAQLELIKKYWIDEYTTPWWWCLLTTIEYSRKLRDFLDKYKSMSKPLDAEIIKHWRTREFGDMYTVMWRKKIDNDKIVSLMNQMDETYVVYNLVDFPWPKLVLFTFWDKVSEETEKEVVAWIQSKVKQAKDEKSLSIKKVVWGKEEVVEVGAI